MARAIVLLAVVVAACAVGRAAAQGMPPIGIPSTATAPACGVGYARIKDDGEWTQSDYLVTFCSKFDAKKNADLQAALNPVQTKTYGPISVKLTGMPLAGGMYEAALAPKKAGKFTLYRPDPEYDDPEYILATEDDVPEVFNMCKAVLKPYLFPYGTYVVGTVKVIATGAVTTSCTTRWGEPESELARKSPEELRALGEEYLRRRAAGESHEAAAAATGGSATMAANPAAAAATDGGDAVPAPRAAAPAPGRGIGAKKPRAPRHAAPVAAAAAQP